VKFNVRSAGINATGTMIRFRVTVVSDESGAIEIRLGLRALSVSRRFCLLPP
jgi:hypothetical protein